MELRDPFGARRQLVLLFELLFRFFSPPLPRWSKSIVVNLLLLKLLLKLPLKLLYRMSNFMEPGCYMSCFLQALHWRPYQGYWPLFPAFAHCLREYLLVEIGSSYLNR